MKIRNFVVTLMLAAMMMISSVAFAQDTCFGLSADDCAVVSGATMNTLTTVTSFKQDWTIAFSVTGVPDGDVTFNATGSGPVVIDMAGGSDVPLAFDQTVTVSGGAPGTELPETTIGAILQGGQFYINAGDGKWMSVDLMEAMAQSGVPLDPEALMSGENPQAAAAMGALPALAGLVEVPGFLTYVREGDNFNFTADVATLIKDPKFNEALTAIAEAGGEETASVAQMGMILPMLLETGTITSVQYVDVAGNVITGIDFNVDASINMGAMSGDTTAAPVVVSLAFTVRLSEANGAFEIVAPEGATPLPMGSGS